MWKNYPLSSSFPSFFPCRKHPFLDPLTTVYSAIACTPFFPCIVCQVPALLASSTQKWGAEGSSKMLITIYQTTRRHIPENHNHNYMYFGNRCWGQAKQLTKVAFRVTSCGSVSSSSYLIISMEQSSWENYSRTAAQIPRLLCDMIVLCCVDMSLSLVPILSHANPGRILPQYFLKIRFHIVTGCLGGRNV
jgi:hypothetical protein